MSITPRALVVDDDRAVRTALRVNLGKAGFDVEVVTSARDALARLHERPFDIVLTDVQMPGATGLELLERIRRSWPDVQVVIMTGYGSVEDAVDAMKAGAADYIIKPIARDELLVILDRALEQRTLRAELVQLRRDVEERYGFENLVGATPVMLSLYEDVAAVADSSVSVLLQGPTGTGKELLAHALHYRSPRAAGPMVRVNCTAIPSSLLESELFGHEKGSFTGAIRQHRGKFEQADGGTLFLDEIGDIDLAMQAKLLRVLESGELQRVGGHETLSVDVRVVTATNRDLAAEVAAGRFREDLFYRLNVITLKVPALSERLDDVPLLVDHFARRLAEREGVPVPRVPSETMARLRQASWPGNVRQLEHVVERAFVLHRKGDVLPIPLPDDALGDAASRMRASSTDDEATPQEEATPPRFPTHLDEDTSLPEAVAAYERAVIIAALQEADGVQAQAARDLGVSKSTLAYRIKKLDIEVDRILYR